MRHPNTELKSDAQVAALPHLDRQYVRSAGDGLQLVVGPKGKTSNGTKRWQCEVKLPTGKTKAHTLGNFPAMSRKQAKTAREAFRAQYKADPDKAIAHKATPKPASDEQSFRAAFTAWHADLTVRKWSAYYSKMMMQRAQIHLFPALGDKAVGDITRVDCVDVIKAVIREPHGRSIGKRKTGSVTQANHVRQHLMLFFEDWLSEQGDEMTRNPVDKLASKTKSYDKRAKQPAVTFIDQAREVLAAVENSNATIIVKLYHRLLALTALRSSEVRGAKWSEIEGNVWNIPEERMKGRRGQKEAHTVYLSDAAVELLNVARALAPRNPVYVFPSPSHSFKGDMHHHQPLGSACLSKLMREHLGRGKHVPHGWRACFSTIMNATVRNHRDVIDAMIAHKGKQVSGSEGDYNRLNVTHVREPATRIAAQWAAMLLEGAPSPWTLAGLKTPDTNVINFPKKHAA